MNPCRPLRLDPQGRIALDLLRRLVSAGHASYFAGGCVRDILLGRSPHDYDIATSATPDDVQELFPDAVLVGRSFPVVRVSRPPYQLDIATFRVEGPYHDGRRPSTTRPGTLEEDARRRDFTINALYLDPDSGDVVDRVDGMADLRGRCIRFVGDDHARVMEDHLRLLRAVRFATTLDFTLAPCTDEAVRRHASFLTRISPDRIHDELVRTLTEAASPLQAWQMLESTGLLTLILPELDRTDGTTRRKHIMFENLACPLPELVIAILFYTDGPADAGRVRRAMTRLRFASDFIDRVVKLLTGVPPPVPPAATSPATRYWIADSDFCLRLEFEWLASLAGDKPLAPLVEMTALRNSMAPDQWCPTPWLTGDDLTELGLAPGPAYATWKRRLYEEQLSGCHADRNALLDWLRVALVNSKDLRPFA